MSPDEAAFLAAIRARPADDTARLVYADWLDERGDADAVAKSKYLRLEVQLAGLPADDPGRDPIILLLRHYARSLTVEWKASVAKVPIENCGPQWEFRCPKGWDSLAPTGEPDVRVCSACVKKVRYCDTIEDARNLAALGECVAVDLTVRRRPGDLESPRTVQMMGMLAPLPRPGPARPDTGLIGWLRRRRGRA